MNGYYAIHARVAREVGGWSSTEHMPTFYLHSVVQGATSTELAERIAVGMIRRVLPTGDNAVVNAHAVFIGEGS